MIGRVAVGRYTLKVGDPAGTAIVPASIHNDPSSLAQAIEQSQKTDKPPPTIPEAFEGVVDDTEQVTSKIEHAVDLFTEVASGRLDPTSISDEVDVLLGLLQRLDRDERWGETIRMARALSTLLALTARWMTLLRSLHTALNAAEHLDDSAAKAWVLHELGTLHLAAEKHADADRLLSKARDIRKQIDDQSGLAMTNHNLQALCHRLRQMLHEPPPEDGGGGGKVRHRSMLTLALAILMLFIGGTAGALIRGSSSSTDPAADHLATVTIHLTPQSPRVNEHVVFNATTADGSTSKAGYAWRFSHNGRSTSATPTRIYRHPGVYEVALVLSDAHGKTVGRASRRVTVEREPFTPASPSTSSTPSTPSAKPTGHPEARFSFQPPSPVTGEPVRFDATTSLDASSSIVSYTWNFGDNRTAHGTTAVNAYEEPGTYTTELTVLDASGASNSTVHTVVVKSQTQDGTSSGASRETAE